MQHLEFNRYPSSHESSSKASGYNLRLRIVVALMCVLVSAPGILVSAGMGVGGLACLLQIPLPPARDLGAILLLGLPFLCSWVAFFHMLWGWLRNRGVSEFWYSWGTFCGLTSVVLANVFALVVLPAILLAIHLRQFHRQLDQQHSPASGICNV